MESNRLNLLLTLYVNLSFLCPSGIQIPVEILTCDKIVLMWCVFSFLFFFFLIS